MSAEKSHPANELVRHHSSARNYEGNEVIGSLSVAISIRSEEVDRREEEEAANEKDGPIDVDVQEWHLLNDVRQAKLNDPADGR